MDNFKIILKKALKKALKSLIKIKFVKIVLVLILILAVLLPAFVYYITIDDGTYKEGDWSNTPYVASTYTNNVKIGEDGITSETTAQDLWDELIRNGSSVDDYLDSPEELEKLMNAEIITQYPKIGNENAKLDGIIEFERHKTDGGTPSKLKYLDSKKFNEYIESNDTTAMDYFTLDEEGNALIAVTNTTTETLTSNDSEMNISEYTETLKDSNKGDGKYERVEINVSSKPIYYKNAVSKYTMPFQYLWKLLVISDDKEFVLELADLVEDSEITISIYDNITTTVNTDKYTYKKETRTDTYVKLTTNTDRYWVAEDNPNYNPNYPADYSPDDTEYNVTHVFTYENNTPIVDLTKANVWIVDYSKTYTYQEKEQISNDTNSIELDDTDYEEKAGSPENSSNNPGLVNNSHAQSFLAEHRARAQAVLDAAKEKEDSDEYTYTMEDYDGHAAVENINVSYVQCNYYTHKINYKVENISTEYSQKYVAGSVISNPKVEKNEGEVNFVTILCDASHIEAKKKITVEVTSWLFELLETGDTANMVDITKYLLYKVTDKSYGITEYDFSVYEPSSMNQISSGVGASYESLNLTESDLEILYKITSAERGGGTQEQQEYVVSVILNRVLSSKFPNTVRDVVFAKNQFQPTRNGAYEAAVPSQTTIDAVNNVVKNGDMAQCAVYFMTPAASLGQQSWLSNCIFLFNDKDDSLQYTDTSGTHNFYTTQDVLDELQQYSKAGSGAVVNSAVEIHKYVRENGYIYKQSGVKVPNDMTKTIDCSSFVTWVLVNANVNGFSSGMFQWTSSTFDSNPYGWQEVSVNDAQPGDILVYNAHVEIIASVGTGNFIVYNCGGNSSIKAQGTSGLPESSTSGYSKSKVKKILRVP